MVGPGPVFTFESLRGSRRWTHYAGRAAFVALLLAAMGVLWESGGSGVMSLRELALLGQQFFGNLATIQLAVVLLAAPAATAGAICVDKGRGTLVHAFATDLRGGEIVRGKLAARFLPLVGLLACGLPVLALGGLLGGVEPAAAIGAYLVTAATGLVACAMALTASVWARQPHQALLVTNTVLFGWIAAPIGFAANVMPLGAFRMAAASWPMALALGSNPFYLAMMPALDASEPAWPYQVAFAAAASAVAAGLTALASWRLRPVVLAQASRPSRRGKVGLAARLVRLLPEPPLEANPVLWREWHRKRPSLWAGRMWTAYTALSFLASAAVIAAFYGAPTPHVSKLAATVNAAQVAIGLLLLSISAAMALAEERDRGSLDVVLTTPLPTAVILRGKWLGAFAMVPRLAILPVWIGGALAMVSGQVVAVLLLILLILAYAAAVVSLGLAIATWVPRLGRAIGASVGAYALVLVGGPLLMEVWRSWLIRRAMMTYSPGSPWMTPPPLRSDFSYAGLSVVSPFDGVGELTGWAGRILSPGFFYGWSSDFEPLHDPGWPIFWIGAYLTIASALFGLTLLTFGRCMGRVAERRRAAAPPVRREPLVPAEVIA